MCRSTQQKLNDRWTIEKADTGGAGRTGIQRSPATTPEHEFGHEIALSDDGPLDTGATRRLYAR
jgi:hypothetical protein